MKVLKPLNVTDAVLTSSSIAEDDHPEWVSGTTYSVGDLRIRASTHRVYKRLTAGAGTTAPESDPTNWLDFAPTNRWAAFDQVVGTISKGPSPLTYVLQTGGVDSVALFELTGKQVQVVLKDAPGGTVVYDRTVALDASSIESFYDWFFIEFEQKKAIALTDLPLQFAQAEMTVTITATGGDAEVGVLRPGTSSDLGETNYNATVGIEDYSKKDRDEFGNLVIVERAYSQRVSATMDVPTNAFARIFRTLASLRATPCVYIGTEVEGYEPMLVYGFFSSFQLEIQYYDYNVCTLEIEGLI